MNHTTKEAILGYLSERGNGISDNEPLFLSQKDCALTVKSLNRLVQQWTSALNLKGHYVSHTLRKTWGYVQRKEFGTPIELIQERYKHSSPSVTRAYLGIEKEEIEEINLKAI